MAALRTLFWKIFVVTFFTTSCVLLAAFGFIRAEFKQQLNAIRQSEQFQQLTEYVVSRYESGDLRVDGRPPAVRDLRRRLPRVRITDNQTGEQLLRGRPDRPDGRSNWVASEYISESGASYKIEVDTSRIPVAKAPNLRPYQYAIVIAIIAVFSGLLTLLITRPIKQLQRHVTALSRGDFDTEIPQSLKNRSDEIGDLAAEIDQMSGRILALIDAKQRLFYDVSHELRAPLARLRAANEITRLKLEKAGDPTENFERFDREIQRLSDLITELMTFAKNEKTNRSNESVNLVELVEQVVDDQRLTAHDNRLKLTTDLTDPVTHTNPQLVERALKNLVENALKYSPQKSDVHISLSDAETDYQMKVSDRGDGIPEDKLEFVTQPFTRLHGESIEGMGLGLSIVKRAVDDLGGSLKLSNLPEGGLLAEIRLPKHST